MDQATYLGKSVSSAIKRYESPERYWYPGSALHQCVAGYRLWAMATGREPLHNGTKPEPGW